MSRKVALLVTAEVETRIIVEVADDFDAENLNVKEFTDIAIKAKGNLLNNLNNDLFECITDINFDNEMPYNENED